MTKENAAQFLPLVQAMADGKEIQYFFDGKWQGSDTGFSFDTSPEFYRVKPETEIIRVWISRFPSGKICSLSDSNMSQHGWKPATAIITEE